MRTCDFIYYCIQSACPKTISYLPNIKIKWKYELMQNSDSVKHQTTKLDFTSDLYIKVMRSKMEKNNVHVKGTS